MLEIKFLGEIRFLKDGKDVTEGISSKCALMIAILLSQKGKKMSRQELMGLFWPESSEKAARYNLRYNLWQLKKTLNDEKEPFLLVSKNSCQINERYAYRCDYLAAAQTNVGRLPDQKSMEGLLESLEGDFFEGLFFEGCEDLDEFIMMQRYSLENTKRTLLKRLVRDLWERKEWDACLRILGENEKDDPYDEENAIIRIKILMEQDKLREAREFYRRFCIRLFSDISMEPGESLRTIGQELHVQNMPQPETFSINCRGIKRIELYGVASFLAELLNQENFRLDSYLSRDEVEELACIQRRMGKMSAQVPSIARLTDDFLELIDRMIKSGKRLVISLETGTMDSVSLAIFGELSRRYQGERGIFQLNEN